ncbi:MAG: hypothetical protein JKX78_14725 [Alteromonadaceae bacterium]|nr:hypothetical protein [Alteromonadaceae bacterium]
MKKSSLQKQWQTYSEKFSHFSTREQVLIALTGTVAIVFSLYFYIAEATYAQVTKLHRQNQQIINDTNNIKNTIVELQGALTRHPNEQLKIQIAQKQQNLAKIDESLLALTSKLVDPIQMRLALEQLLRMQKGVKLTSFEVQSAQPLIIATNEQSSPAESGSDKKAKNSPLNSHLYRHTIKLTLEGSYFKLRDYLAQLETLPWKFFWEKFDYKLTKYPKGELTIEIYSLSLKQEFIGV